MVIGAHRMLNECTDTICALQRKYCELSDLMKNFEKSYQYDIEERLLEFNKEYGYIIRALGFEEETEKNPEAPCFVYYIFNEEKDKVKIGISSDPLRRAKELQTSCGEEISILHTIKFPSREKASEAEQFLHGEFSQFRRKPSKVARSCEWFDACIIEDLMQYYDTEEHIESLKEYEKQRMREIMNGVHIEI